MAELTSPAWVRCNALHTLATARLVRRLGDVDAQLMTTVQDRVLRLLFMPLTP
jgi:mRNA-degrading endonuclease toxin of MazEF toxin-antitoxin module